ncbi:hypothetical protein EVAR_35244_1 [Eumeta japonica]|uniref:Uncharacterized protein n=1 Tax=Eumeta variegata TaxID=151549 RepID=A0A4C1VDI4_EUMVA|nr:hypothetical protein EVAR_35244_1 [Eumeta japonica]
MNDCREHREHALIQIQLHQAEFDSNRMQTDILQHEMDMCKADETVCDIVSSDRVHCIGSTFGTELHGDNGDLFGRSGVIGLGPCWPIVWAIGY